MSNTRTFFAFKEKKSGDLVRVDEYDGSVSLAEPSRKECPVFEAGSPEQLAELLVDNTRHYNSWLETPSWGPFKPDDLEPVKVTITMETSPVTLPERPKFKTIELRDIPSLVANRYAGTKGTPQAPGKPGYVFWLVELPAGETLESAQRWVGKEASPQNDRWTKRHVYALVQVPDDYVPLTAGKGACALCIASNC